METEIQPTDANVNTILPKIVHNVPSSMGEIEKVTGADDSLLGKYCAIISNEEYQIVRNNEQENNLRNPTLVREPGHSELGKVGISLDISDGRELEIILLFNNGGNSVIALSSMGDFVVDGKPIENMPTVELNYFSVNYYRETTSASDTQNGDFELSVNFESKSGSFTSGFTGQIRLDGSTGNYTGRIGLENSTFDDLEIKGKFHGDDDRGNTSVTGLYYGGTSDNLDIIGAIIGTNE